MNRFENILLRMDRSIAVKVVVIAAGLLICVMPQLRYAALHTAFYDLGQYATNYMVATREGFEGIMLRGHAHMLMAVIVPLFKIMPFVETLLALQSLILLGGIWLYAGLWHKLVQQGVQQGRTLAAWSRWSAALVCMVSLSVWSSALFDYHFEHLLVPLYVLFFWQLESKSKWQAFGLIALALAIAMTKESYALTSIGLGLYLVLARRHIPAGFGIIILSSSYFAWVTMQVIPAYSDGLGSGDLWRNAFAYLGRTPAEMLVTLVTEPRRLVDAHVLTLGKAIYAGALLGPFLLVLWRVPLLLVPALPSLAIAMLSLEPNHSYLVNQYSVSISVPVLVALLYAMSGCQDRHWASMSKGPVTTAEQSRMFALVLCGSIVSLFLFSPAPLSRLFWKSEAWSFHHSAYWPTERDRRITAMIERYIPADPDLAVSMQNTLHTGRLSLRYHALGYPQGVFEPARMLDVVARRYQTVSGRSAPDGMIWVDYVVLDHLRPAYLNDRLVRGAAEAQPSAEALLLRDLHARLPEDFIRITHDDGFEIWQRKPRQAVR